MTMIEFLLALITMALGVMSAVAIVNTFAFPRLKRSTRDINHDKPFVSVLIPARNEAAIIEQTLSRLLNQDYPYYEVLLLDDQSTDKTVEIAQRIAQNDSRLKIISGAPLPEGWLGKNWACYQLAQQARGAILIFTDADVEWREDALSALLTMIATNEADLLAVWPTQITHSFAERLVVPLMAFAIHNYLPVWFVHHTPFSIFAAANGQCMAWRRKAYEQLGGHACVADNILEDVTFARLVKKNGLRLWMADANGYLYCRMYRNWAQARDGFAKNILAGYGDSVVFLCVGIVFHLTVFILPWLLALSSMAWRQWALLLIVQGLGLRALSAAFTRQRARDALFLPLSVIAMTIIALQAIWWRFNGGPRWKGRSIPQKTSKLNKRWSAPHAQ